MKDLGLKELGETEINGIRWVYGTATGGKTKAILYACQIGEGTFTFSFNTDYPEVFYPANFAEVFLREVTAN